MGDEIMIVTVGEKIRSIREEKGYTQKQVAAACGMVDSAIRKYESGAAHPKIATVSKIAAALGVETLELTKDDPYYPIISLSLDKLLSREMEPGVFYFPDDCDGIHFSYDQLTEEHVLRVAYEFERMNEQGKDIAVERVKELAENPRYQKQKEPPQEDPQNG